MLKTQCRFLQRSGAAFCFCLPNPNLKWKGKAMKQYEGRRTGRGVEVTGHGVPLNPRLDLRQHSPTGFEWGSCGSGPAQLALAMLADHLDDDEQALNLYQRFKWAVIAELPRKRWTLTSREIDDALQRIREQAVEGVAS
jgi:hypothetical protein